MKGKFAVGFASVKGQNIYYYGDVAKVEEIFKEIRKEVIDHRTEVVVVRYYDTEADMKEYLDEKKDFLNDLEIPRESTTQFIAV